MSQDRREDDHRLNEILEHLKSQDRLFDLKIEPIRKMLEMHDRTLFGDGNENNQGLRVEVDRIKQKGVLINWALGAMGIPFFGYIGKKFIDFLRS